MANSQRSERKSKRWLEVMLPDILISVDDLEKFKDQKLPLARIKKIMKSDEDVRVSELICWEWI